MGAMNPTKTVFAALASLAITAGAAAAQDSIPVPMSNPSAQGTWELVEVEGTELPFATEEAAECSTRVTAGMLVLEAGGEWELELTEEETCGTEVSEDTETEEGEYAVDGMNIDFLVDDEMDTDEEEAHELDELVSGTLEGDMLRVMIGENGIEAVFRRAQM